MEIYGLLHPQKKSDNSISTVASLSEALGVSCEELIAVSMMSPEQLYTEKTIPKAGGKERTVFNPHRRLRKIQRRINSRILADKDMVKWPVYLYGSISNQEYDVEDFSLNGKDYVSCAARHCGARSLLKLDVQSFFDNIHFDAVFDIFSGFFKYPEEVSRILATLCCRGEHVVQGGITSSYLASLCMYDVEGNVAKRLHRKGLVYTRLVDDITISAKSVKADFSYAKNLVIAMLESKDLPVNDAKTQIHRAGTKPLTVHGLRVGFSTPRLPADEVRRIRAAVRNVESLAAENNYRTSHSYRHDYNRCMGRVNKLRRVGHNQHENLKRRLLLIKPLPSLKDIGRAKQMVERLRSDFPTRAHLYWYRKRYFKLQERLNVIKRTYTHVAHDFRVELKGLKPIKNQQ